MIVLAVVLLLAIGAYSFLQATITNLSDWINQSRAHGHKWKINFSVVTI